jgi:dermatan 4-sulfotransferase 1
VNERHFIQFRDLPLLYGRVPKVANSSIKACLYRLLTTSPEKGLRTTSDAFWSKGTHGETSMVDNHSARMCRGTHFSFSFVRNPFDRLVSAYNNKILELDDVPGPMQAMGLSHGMVFSDFLECIAGTMDAAIDVHLLPQSSILCLDGQLIPSFIGRLETMETDWQRLETRLKQERLPPLGHLPEKNRRRGDDHTDVSQYFADSGLVQLVVERYSDDLGLFYGDVNLEVLSRGQLS